MTTLHKTQTLWLEASAVLAAIVDKSDTAEISDGEIIQGIRNAILLLGNASQQHSLQTILQHLNPKLKSLVQDADFAKAPPYLFGTNFGELAKERLEAAALIQKAAQKAPQNFQKRHPQKFTLSGWQPELQRPQQRKRVCWGFKRQFIQQQELTTDRQNNSCAYQFTCSKNFSMYSSVNTPSEPCSTPPGVDRQAKCQSLTRRVLHHLPNKNILTIGSSKQYKGI